MDTRNWKWFRYDEVFEIKKGKRLTKADMEDGTIPYIGATDSNNGITNYISNDRFLHEPNTITVSYNGSIAEAYYQTKKYWATDDVNVLYPRFSLNKYIAMYLITIINKEKYRFNYGRKWDKESMQESKIKLPVTFDGTPDWDWIENYVKTDLLPALPPKARAVWQKQYDLQPLNPTPLYLTDRQWKEFKYEEIFDIKKGFYNKRPEDNPQGNIPFIGATDSNNGVTSFCDIETIDRSSKTGEGENAELSKKIFDGNCITVSNNGSVGYAFYQTKEFTCTHDVNPLYLKGYIMNPYIAFFLCTLIEKERFRWAYGRKWRPSRMPYSIIRLPITPSGSPDWQFMEDYIKSLPYSRNI